MPGSREEKSAFSLYNLYGHVLAQESLPWCHEMVIQVIIKDKKTSFLLKSFLLQGIDQTN